MIPGYSRENFRGSNYFQLTEGDGFEESACISWFMREFNFCSEVGRKERASF